MVSISLSEKFCCQKSPFSKNDFPFNLKKIIVRYKKIGHNIDVLRPTASLVVNPIKVNSFAYLFNFVVKTLLRVLKSST